MTVRRDGVSSTVPLDATGPIGADPSGIIEFDGPRITGRAVGTTVLRLADGTSLGEFTVVEEIDDRPPPTEPPDTTARPEPSDLNS